MSGAELTPTRFERVRALFDEAMERDPAERGAYLAAASGGDRALAAEVEALLAALGHWNDTRPPALGALLDEALTEHETAGAVGRRIGPYEVTRLVGVGGMGAVYEGVRADREFDRRVAIKFLRRGLEGDLAVRRFRYERQILANLSHPNIAALLDGGVTSDGQPYFVMEFVDGEPITTHCARHALDLRARVRLLRQVCAAVQHAHQHLVVHRDLKPGNVLVDAEGTVKLLDFGIARLLRDPDGVDALPATQGGMRAFTPDYASPEQVRGLPVATASDVYSLGVVCCELLSGHRPFDLHGRLHGEIQETVCLVPAPAPSSLVTDADAPRFGQRSAARVRAQLAGDLDAIVLHALRKEPERRYGSVERLSDDLQRWLDGLPVTAQRDRLGYRLGKFLRRRRVEVTAAALAVASLVGGVVVSVRAARRAEVERGKTEQVNEFLANILASADPGNSGRDVTVVEALAKASRDVRTARLDPEIEAQVRHTLAQTYYELGHYDSATVHAQRALDLRRQVFGERNRQTVYSLSYVIGLAEARGSFAEAESLARVNVRLQRRMGWARDNPADLSSALDGLARSLTRQGRTEEAVPLLLESLELLQQVDDSASRATLPYALTNLAVTHGYLGKNDSAIAFARQAVDAERRVNGTTSVVYGSALRALAGLLDEVGRTAEADSVVREAITVLRAVVGPSHTEYLRAVNLLATVRFGAGDMAGTVAAAREVTSAIGGGLHESENAASASLQTLGLALDSLGEHAAADSALRRSLALRRRYMPPDHWAIASSEAMLGHHLGLMGRHAEAEEILRGAYRKVAEARGAESSPAKRVAARLAELLARIGRPEEAAEWRARS